MEVIDTIRQMQLSSAAWQREGQRVAFVPTMGNLHAGHLSLVEKARQECDQVVVSIFVNPLQFDDGEDFSRYPRSLEQDRDQLAALKVDALFVPGEQELYPQGKEAITRVEVPVLSGLLEGASRAGHFTGVTTVVNKLFNIVQPDVAVFGEKDFQQLLIVQQMVNDLNMPVHIIGMPTAREADGLAMSSRNHRLTADQRDLAPLIYQTLQGIREALLQGENDMNRLGRLAFAQLQNAGFEPDYVELRNALNLEQADENTSERVILLAARLGEIRLIDNLRV